MKKIFVALLAITLIVSLSISALSEQQFEGHGKGIGDITVTLSTEDGTVVSATLDASDETPEIGGVAVTTYYNSYIESLIGKKVEEINTDQMDAFTGATLTGAGIRNALADALAQASGVQLEKQALTDGVYTYTTTGFGGNVEVTVTINQGAIQDIVIGENNETAGVGTKAIAMLPAQIVEAQSTGIDGISGATMTSTAIISAVNKAIEEAGGTAAWSVYAYEDYSENAPIELTTDVVVVGGGGAGLSAALSVVNHETEVIVLEKTSILGGNTALSEGHTVITGSKYEMKVAQENVDAGLTDYQNTLNDSPEKLYHDIMVTGHFLSNPDTLWAFANHAGEAWDFIIDNTVFEAYGTEMRGETIEGELMLRAYRPTTGRGTEFTVPMENAIRESGYATILTRTEGYELIYDETANTVVGVKAVNNQNGQQYIVYANKGVIVSTGLLTGQNAADCGVTGLYNMGLRTNTGDGQRMLLEVGADTWLMGLTARGGRMITDNFEYAPGLGITVPGIADLFANSGALAVEVHGRRFSDETEILNNNELIANLSGGCYYIIMDEKSFQDYIYVNNGQINRYALLQFDTWLEQNNCEPGGIAHAETIQEAAKLAGIDPDRLNATIQYYNYCVEQGLTDMYKKENAKALSDEGEYIIMRIQPAFNSSSGGILVNQDCAVYNTDGEIIKGLYAAGNVAGGANGEIYYMGGTVGWAITSGYLAGQAASK